MRPGHGKLVKKKCPQGESNPCHHLERVVSLPLDDGGGTAEQRQRPHGWKIKIAVTGFEPVF